jgi:hypothetical protein
MTRVNHKLGANVAKSSIGDPVAGGAPTDAHQLQRQPDVVGHCRPRHQRRFLEDEANVPLGEANVPLGEANVPLGIDSAAGPLDPTGTHTVSNVLCRKHFEPSAYFHAG